MIVPTLADHVTALEKLPVPWTEAEHELVWLVCPAGRLVGVQETLTAVIVGVGGGLLPPPAPLPAPPQPTNRDERAATKAIRTDRLERRVMPQLRTKVTKAASLR